MRSMLLVTCAGLIGASSLPDNAEPVQQPDKFVIEAGQHDIKDLVDRSAAFLGRNYLYSEADFLNAPESTVRLQHRLELDAQGCEEVVGQLAYTVGYAMLPVDAERGIYQWIFRQGPKRSEIPTSSTPMEPEEVMARRNSKMPVLTTIPLQHINATAAQNQLRPFFLAGGGGAAQIQFGVAGQALLVQGFADQVAAAIELLRKVDVPPPGQGHARVSGAFQDEETGSVQSLLEWREQIEERLQHLENKIGK